MGTIPDGLEYGHFTNGDGASIRYAKAMPPADKLVAGQPTGVVVLVTGFRESIERYYERIREHQERGQAVYTMDWRGQGGSQRYKPSLPQRAGSQGYEHDVADLHQFIAKVAKIDERHPGVRKTLHAHSMGGNIGLRYLHDHPGRFDNAVITSPMLGINTGKVPKWLARTIAKAMSVFDKHAYMPTEGDWSEQNPMQELKGTLNERMIRQGLQDVFYRDMPPLRLGGATAGWFLEACRSIAILRDPDYLKNIKTPIMMVAGRLDDIVEPQAIRRAAKHLPNVTFHEYPRSAHSPWMESDTTRRKLWQHVNDFQAGYQRPGPKTLLSRGTPPTTPPPKPWITRAAKGLSRRLTSGPDARRHRLPESQADSPSRQPANDRHPNVDPANRRHRPGRGP